MDKRLILNRLKDAKNLANDKELADFLGIAKSTLSNWITRDTLNYDLMFSKCKQINFNWLLTGEGEIFNENEGMVAEPMPSFRKTADPVYESQRVPLYNLEATMGLIPLMANNGPDDERIIDYLTIPNLPSCDGSIYATGDSMYPLLKAGDIVAYKTIPANIDEIFFGEIYVLAIYLDKETTIKTIKFVKPSEKGDDYIKLVSHNQHHADKHVKLEKISALGLVRASIRLHN